MTRIGIGRDNTGQNPLPNIPSLLLQSHVGRPSLSPSAYSYLSARMAKKRINCDQVYPGIYLANAETVQDFDYLKVLMEEWEDT